MIDDPAPARVRNINATARWPRIRSLRRAIVLRAVTQCALLLLLVASCTGRTKEQMIERTRDVTTRTELQAALGKPDNISKVGPLETWTYRASNGDVVFVILGERVTLQAAGGSGARDDKGHE